MNALGLTSILGASTLFFRRKKKH
ncbi:MAG: LPXTG cell wall anchor domain-containing protein [Vagococcus sp.]